MSLATGLSAVVLLAAGCGDDESGSPEATPPPAPTTATPPASATTATPAPRPAATGTRIKLDDSQFGEMLFDARGQAIYLFAKEKTSRPECYGECADAWPPVFTEGKPRGGKGVNARLLGTTRRRDGRMQVTYNGHPLYFYANEGRGEVRCHNVFLNGGLWLVVGANGRALD